MKAVYNCLNHAWYVVKVTIEHQNDNNTLSRIKPFNTFIPEIANSSCHFLYQKEFTKYVHPEETNILQRFPAKKILR